MSVTTRRVSSKTVAEALGAVRDPRVDRVVYILLPKDKQWKPRICEFHPGIREIDDRIFTSLRSAKRWLVSCGPDVEAKFEPVPVQMREIGV